MEELYERIVDTFRSRIPNTNWMDADTKSRAVDKVDALGYKIGYPDFLLDPSKLDEYYSKARNRIGFFAKVEAKLIDFVEEIDFRKLSN